MSLVGGVESRAESGLDPALGIAQVKALRVASDASARQTDEAVVVEAPFQIMKDGEVLATTMRTPGHDEELTHGFLLAEGQLAGAGDARAPVRRGTLSSAACGVCGRDGIDDLVAWLSPVACTTRFSRSTLSVLTDNLSRHQPTFARTGGLHAAGLADTAGNFLIVREDVGRHNAVDKVLGRAFLNGLLPLSHHVLVVSGRTSFEIVQKAVAAQVPALVAVSAPSSLAIELAERFGVLLIGFARAGGFTAYAGADRIEA